MKRILTQSFRKNAGRGRSGGQLLDAAAVAGTRYVMQKLRGMKTFYFEPATAKEIGGAWAKHFSHVSLNVRVGLAAMGHPAAKGVTSRTDEDANATITIVLGFVAGEYIAKQLHGLYRDVLTVLRHELRHAVQDWETVSYVEDPRYFPSSEMGIGRHTAEREMQRDVYYMTSPAEIEAYVEGFYLKAKKSRVPFVNLVKAYLSSNFLQRYLGRLPPDVVHAEHDKIVSKWVQAAKGKYGRLEPWQSQRKSPQILGEQLSGSRVHI
jgi:hypothetical protein